MLVGVYLPRGGIIVCLRKHEDAIWSKIETWFDLAIQEDDPKLQDAGSNINCKYFWQEHYVGLQAIEIVAEMMHWFR